MGYIPEVWYWEVYAISGYLTPVCLRVHLTSVHRWSLYYTPGVLLVVYGNDALGSDPRVFPGWQDFGKTVPQILLDFRHSDEPQLPTSDDEDR